MHQRIYEIRRADDPDATVAICTVHVISHPVRVHFDSGSTYYFIYMDCVNIDRLSACETFVVKFPSGDRIMWNQEVRDCPMRIAESVWSLNLIVTGIIYEDLILSYDWIDRHGVIMNYHTRVFSMLAEEGTKYSFVGHKRRFRNL